LVARILKAERPVIITGDEIVKSDALREAAQLAETLGAPAYQCSTPYARISCRKPCFMGALSRLQKQVREVLSPYDLMNRARRRSVADVGLQRSRSAARWARHVQVGLVDWDLAKNYSAEIALKPSQELRALIPALKAAGAARSKRGAGRPSRAGPKKLDREAQGRDRTDFQSQQQIADRPRLAGVADGRGDADNAILVDEG